MYRNPTDRIPSHSQDSPLNPCDVSKYSRHGPILVPKDLYRYFYLWHICTKLPFPVSQLHWTHLSPDDSCSEACPPVPISLHLPCKKPTYQSPDNNSPFCPNDAWCQNE